MSESIHWPGHGPLNVLRTMSLFVELKRGKLLGSIAEMGKYENLLQQILSGRSDANIRFNDLCNLLLRLGFQMRTSGSHHVFRRSGIEEKVNLQRDGNKAKPYQVRQVRQVFLRYKLGGPS